MSENNMNAAGAQMMYAANSKSMGLAYVLWLFLGGFGGHRFYAGKIGSGVAMIAIMFLGIITSFIGVGIFLMIGVGIWALVDAFLIPGWIQAHNTALAVKFSGSAV